MQEGRGREPYPSPRDPADYTTPYSSSYAISEYSHNKLIASFFPQSLSARKKVWEEERGKAGDDVRRILQDHWEKHKQQSDKHWQGYAQNCQWTEQMIRLIEIKEIMEEPDELIKGAKLGALEKERRKREKKRNKLRDYKESTLLPEVREQIIVKEQHIQVQKDELSSSLPSNESTSNVDNAGSASPEAVPKESVASPLDEGRRIQLDREKLKEEGRKRFEEKRRRLKMEQQTGAAQSPTKESQQELLEKKKREEEERQRILERERIAAQEAKDEEFRALTTNALLEFCDNKFPQQKSQASPEGGANQRQFVRILPFVVPSRQAADSFAAWRNSIWFAPTGVDAKVDHVSHVSMFVPYYSITTTVLIDYKAHIAEVGEEGNILTASGRLENKTKRWKEVTGTKEIVYENILVCASVEEDDHKAFGRLRPYGMNVENATPLAQVEGQRKVDKKEGGKEKEKEKGKESETENNKVEKEKEKEKEKENEEGKQKICVREHMDSRDVWKSVEKELLKMAKESCKHDILQAMNKSSTSAVTVDDAPVSAGPPAAPETSEVAPTTPVTHSVHDIKELVITKLAYKGRVSYIIVYVPIHVIHYTYRGRPSTFLVHGSTGRSHGERPYGAGNILGSSIGSLEVIFGKEQTCTGILSGQILKRIDNCGFYKDDTYYLVFPSSHSYLITSGTGYVTLQNTGTYDIKLESRPRGSDKVIGTYLLRAGQTETFDYRGSWCIELQTVGPSCEDPPLRLVDCQTSGGGTYGNKLSMSYWLL